MDAWESLALVILVVLVIAAVAVICGFAALGAVSGYVAGRRAASSTGRSGAMAGLVIGAVVGVLECLLFIFVGDTMWVILLPIGALSVIVGPALFAYRRDLRTSTTLVLLGLGVAVVAVLGAMAAVAWLIGAFDEPGGPPPPDGSLLWQYETGNQYEGVIVSPTLADGVLYAGSYEGFVYALDAETGELLWRFETKNEQNLPPEVALVNPPPTVADGIVYVVRAGGELFALDAYTGERLWNDEPVYAGSLLSDGIRYMPDLDFDAPSLNVRAIDERSGDLRWDADVPRSSEFPLIFPLTASRSNVYVSDYYLVHALDSTTGRLAWSFDAGDIVDAPPRGSDGVVYLRSYSAAYALDESTGEQLWSYDVEGYAGPGRPPFIADGVWALVDGVDAVQALDAATGQPLWSYEDDYVIFISGVANGMVFVTGDEAFHALDAATGREIWSLDADWGLGEVTVVDGVLYANSLDGYLHTFDARTGESFWSVEVGYHHGGADKPYLVSGGVVYVGYQLANSGVYAFTAPGGGR